MSLYLAESVLLLVPGPESQFVPLELQELFPLLLHPLRLESVRPVLDPLLALNLLQTVLLAALLGLQWFLHALDTAGSNHGKPF